LLLDSKRRRTLSYEPKTPEGRIKKEIREYLDAIGAYSRALEIGAIPGRKNSSAGMLDRIVIYHGRVIWFEVKTESGRLSEKQEDFLVMWNLHGGEAYLVRSLAEVWRVMENPPAAPKVRLASARQAIAQNRGAQSTRTRSRLRPRSSLLTDDE
jgi:hypothetical protein